MRLLPDPWWEGAEMTIDDLNRVVDEVELSHLRAENARLTRDNACLRRQLDALLDTQLGEALTRNQELAAEVQDLKAKLARLGVTA